MDALTDRVVVDKAGPSDELPSTDEISVTLLADEVLCNISPVEIITVPGDNVLVSGVPSEAIVVGCGEVDGDSVSVDCG